MKNLFKLTTLIATQVFTNFALANGPTKTSGTVVDANDVAVRLVDTGAQQFDSSYCMSTFLIEVDIKDIGPIGQYTLGNSECGNPNKIGMELTRLNLLLDQARKNNMNIQIGGMTLKNIVGSIHIIGNPHSGVPLKAVSKTK